MYQQFMKPLLITCILLVSISFAEEISRPSLEIFYKERKPSQMVLGRLKEIVKKHEESYDIIYYNIEDAANAEIIKSYGLPSTHFPVAVLINGKFCAKIDGNVVHFVHFPVFMNGIGRHEGDWKIEDVDKALADNSILLDENQLPDINDGTSNCEDGQ